MVNVNPDVAGCLVGPPATACADCGARLCHLRPAGDIGHASERAAMPCRRAARGADKAITANIDARVRPSAASQPMTPASGAGCLLARYRVRRSRLVGIFLWICWLGVVTWLDIAGETCDTQIPHHPGRTTLQRMPGTFSILASIVTTGALSDSARAT